MPGTGSLSLLRSPPRSPSPGRWSTSLMKAVRDFGLEEEVWRLSTNSRGGEMMTLSQGLFGSDGDDMEDLMGLVFLLFSNIFTRFETPAGVG